MLLKLGVLLFSCGERVVELDLALWWRFLRRRLFVVEGELIVGQLEGANFPDLAIE